jgi:phospholipid transport system transporter-binding protein
VTAVDAHAFKLDLGTPGTVVVNGVLNFDTAAAALQEIRMAVARGRVTQLDLAGVEHSDSAGLSCIVAVMAESVQAGHSLQVVHMPAGLRALAQVCEVDRLLG